MEENGTQKNQRLSTKVRKQIYLEALEKTMGIQTPARKTVGNLSPETVRQWREKDKDFAAKMQNAIVRTWLHRAKGIHRSGWQRLIRHQDR